MDIGSTYTSNVTRVAVYVHGVLVIIPRQRNVNAPMLPWLGVMLNHLVHHIRDLMLPWQHFERYDR